MNRPMLFVSLLAVVCLSRSGWSQGIDAAARAEDARLEKPVSVSETHIALCELLRRFADQSGMSLEIDPLDTSSGYDLFAHCESVPVGTMMDAVYGLVSAHGAEWKWLRSGKPGSYSYLLVETFAAKQRAERNHALGHKIFRDFMAMMGRLSAMDPTERARHKADVRAGLKLDADDVIDAFIQEPSHWSGARLFFGSLSPEQQQGIYSGGKFAFQVNQLPQAMQAEFRSTFAATESSSVQPDGSLKRDPEPDAFTITYQGNKPGAFGLAPEVQIQYQGNFGMSLLGSGFPSYAVRASTLKEWMLPGDASDDPAADRIVADKRILDPPDTQKISPEGRIFSMPPPGAMAAHLREMAAGSSVPILAVLPGPEHVLINKPVKFKVRELLTLMVRGLHEMYKWRGGVLLLNNPDWFFEGEPAVPYHWQRVLMGTKEAPASVADIAQVNSKIDASQAQWLATHLGLKGFSRLGPLLNYATNHPRLMTPDGFEIRPEDLPPLLSQGYFKRPDRPGWPLRVRLVRNVTADGATVPLQIRVEQVDVAANRWVLSTIQDIPWSKGMRK